MSIRRNESYRALAAAWARSLMQAPFLILDTETTGLQNRDEIISVSVVNHEGAVLLDTLIKPQNPIPYDATHIHGITDADVADAPPFTHVYPQLCNLLRDQTLVVYNLSFDRRMLEANRQRYGLMPLEHRAEHCAMLWYAKFHGEIGGRQGAFRWQKLTTACTTLGIPVQRAHSAAGDCLLTLEVIRRMAAY